MRFFFYATIGLVPLFSGAQETGFRYVRAIENNLTEDALAGVILDSEIYRQANLYKGTLKLSETDSDKSIPFRILDVNETRLVFYTKSTKAMLSGVDKTDDGGAVILCSIDKDFGEIDSISIETHLTNFEKRMKLEGSGDLSDWEVLIDKTTIFDYSEIADVRRTRFSIPSNQHRYFRISVDRIVADERTPLREITTYSVDDETTQLQERIRRVPFRLDGITFSGTREKEKVVDRKKTTYPVGEVSFDKSEGVVEWKSNREPITEFVLAADAKNFKRKVVLRGKNREDSDWKYLTTKSIFHYQLGDYLRTDMTLNFPESRMDRYQLKIWDTEDQSLIISPQEATGPMYRLVWLADAGKGYNLFIDGENKSLRPDTSAITALLNAGFAVVEAKWKGEVKANPHYRKSNPGTGRLLDGPWFLYSAIGLTILALIVVLAFAVKKVEAIEE